MEYWGTMQKINHKKLYSASDLVNFLACEHLTSLDLMNLDSPLPKAEDDDQAKLIQKKGLEHEDRYLQGLISSGISVFDAKTSGQNIATAAKATREAMRAGAPVIFQGCLHSSGLVGYVDFLRKTDSPSRLGCFSYEVVDTKLARTAKAKFIIQLCLYSDLLSAEQGFLPSNIHVILGDCTQQSYRLADYFRYYRSVKARFMDRVSGKLDPTYPEPCAHCDLCHWRYLCKEQWIRDDHLCQVANITKIQTGKFQSEGISTLAELAQLTPDDQVTGMQDGTLHRLCRQAVLQHTQRETGQDIFELLEIYPSETRGLQRLPQPDSGDLFFDMEGDPLEDGGLEYLFGLYYHDRGEPQFKTFWAHSRKEERLAFQNFIAFVMERLSRYPDMHIYHYAPYEVTALKRLMSLHGTCEAEVDHLLRSEKLVDLYKVVRESLLTSEPRYSIKNLETFYMEKRTGVVTDAGSSIVFYEDWKETQDSSLLQQIHDYNEDDCRSTYLLREWLLSIRPDNLTWFNANGRKTSDSEKSERVHEAEERLADYEKQLLGHLSDNRSDWDKNARMRELVYQLLDFHRRAAKPAWWAMFARQEMTEEELIQEPEAIGHLVTYPDIAPEPVKQSLIYTFSFPEQEFKLKAGDECLCADSLEPAGRIESIDEINKLIRIKRSKRRGSPPSIFSVIASGPINTKILTEAIFRFADSVINGTHRYRAIEAILERAKPQIKGRTEESPILTGETDIISEVSEAVSGLQDSYLFIQGPPGAGKTYTGSYVIANLLEQGARVGISSNSHKAINNLLAAVEARLEKRSVTIQGVKKSSGPDTFFNGTLIKDVTDKHTIICSGANLVAGTAWLFADPDLDQSLDYLFVDEAGQVALANLIAMGTCAKNIVLLGDQMQLQQPIQGVHPGHSGESTLDYLLQEQATITDNQGVFLGTTWRMHQDVCKFISDAVYESRLNPEPMNQNQRLVLSSSAHQELQPTGIRFVPIEHDGCSQRSEEEAALICDLYDSLLAQRYVDRNGSEHQISSENILVVAPYNMQVNLLKSLLPDGARVGTVDKFQGQEAEAVIISMATSSAYYLPRFMEFLFSKNRLNVALSRARCLAILVANPKLMAIKCNTVEQMALVNTLCWIAENSENYKNPLVI